MLLCPQYDDMCKGVLYDTPKVKVVLYYQEFQKNGSVAVHSKLEVILSKLHYAASYYS